MDLCVLKYYILRVNSWLTIFFFLWSYGLIFIIPLFLTIDKYNATRNVKLMNLTNRPVALQRNLCITVSTYFYIFLEDFQKSIEFFFLVARCTRLVGSQIGDTINSIFTVIFLFFMGIFIFFIFYGDFL